MYRTSGKFSMKLIFDWLSRPAHNRFNGKFYFSDVDLSELRQLNGVLGYILIVSSLSENVHLKLEFN